MRRPMVGLVLGLVIASPVAAQSPSPSQDAAVEPSALPSIISDGTHIVGVDILPGTYRTPGADGCYWERMSGFGGTADEIIANDNPAGPAVVTILPADVGFTTQGCGTWTAVSLLVPASAAPEPSQMPGLSLHGSDLVFDELNRRAPMGVTLPQFMKAWNRDVDRSLRMKKQPKIERNPDGVRLFQADFSYEDDYFGLLGAMEGKQLGAVMLNWTRSNETGGLYRSMTELNALLTILALIQVFEPDEDIDFEALGWPTAEEDPASYIGVEGQVTVGDVVVTLTAVPSDRDPAYESVLVTVRPAGAQPVS